MKTARKAILTVLCVCLVVLASVMGTLAYLTDDDAVTNTFTVGDVKINLDEAPVDENGKATDADRVKENDYHLMPGQTYDKDPTVTVLKGSEETYVRMLVTFTYSSQLDAIFAPTGAQMTSIFGGYDPANWQLIDDVEDAAANTRTYEFRYVGSKDQGSKAGTVAKAEDGDIVLDDLFETITVPGFVDNDQLASLVTLNEDGEIVDQFKIHVEAHAIQAAGFDSADEAWAAFDIQNP